MKQLILGSLLMIVSMVAAAGNLTLNSYLDKVDIQAGKIIKLKAYSSTDVNYTYTAFASRVNVVRLMYSRDQQTDVLANGEWRYIVDFKIYNNNDPSAFHNGSLTVNFIDGEAVYEDVSRFNVAFTHATVEILSVTASQKVGGVFTVVANPHSSSIFPADIRLELQTITTSYDRFSIVAIPKLKFLAPSKTLAWSFVRGAEEYDIEWVHIDDEEELPSAFVNDEDPFEYKEPMRVRTNMNHYEIDLAYPAGRIYFRVRAVGRHTDGVNGMYHFIKEGNWSYNDGASSTAIYYDVINSFEKDLNWQYQSTYAENGKHKSVISYFDGTGKNRQQQTNLSTDEVTLVGETRYDSEGRGVIQMLPAPKESNNFNYEMYFNKAEGETSFLPEHFEGGTVKGLSDASGAGKYYSKNNPFTNHPFRSSTPIAEGGYAFTQIEYVKDNTGDVRRQSGLGSTFKLGDEIGEGRSTEYYYGNPSSTELHRLFGSDVGEASHYTKTITIDANEGLSITYADQEGRTIATSLVGQGPSNLTKLPSNVSAPIRVNFNANNVRDGEKGEVRSVNKILNPERNRLYSFNYDFQGALYSSGAGTCVDCEYDLSITITDPEGEKIDLRITAPGSMVDTLNGIQHHYSNSVVANCANGSFYPPLVSNIQFNATFAKIGDYTVTKTLTISTANLQQKIDDALDAAGLGQTYLDHLTDSLTTEVDTLECIENCDDYCEAKYAGNAQLIADCKAGCLEDVYGADYLQDSVFTVECDAILNYIKANGTVPSPNNLDPGIGPNDPEWYKNYDGYCHYEICMELAASKNFDYQMGTAKDWATASTGGKDYNDPTSGNNIDPFIALLDVWEDEFTPNKTLKNDFLAELNNYYEIPGSSPAQWWSLEEFTNPATGFNPTLYDNIPGGGSDENRWRIFRGIYLNLKLKYIEEYKTLKPCDYADMPLLAKPPLDMADYQAQQYNYLDVTTPEDCDAICEVNVEFWMRELIDHACVGQLSHNDTVSLRLKLAAFCEENCGDDNPFGVLIREELAAGNNTLLNDIDVILANAGCSSDSIFINDPYIRKYTPERALSPTEAQCLQYFVDFYNTEVVNGVTATTCSSPAASGPGANNINADNYYIKVEPGHPLYSCLPDKDMNYVVFETDFAIRFDSLAGICNTLPRGNCILLVGCGNTGHDFTSLQLLPTPHVKSYVNSTTGATVTTTYEIEAFGGPTGQQFLTTDLNAFCVPNDWHTSCYGSNDTTCTIVGINDTIIPYIPPCADRLFRIAEHHAEERYNEHVRLFEEDFLDEYMEKCFDTDESFYVDYIDNEYHYTLYYYDQAGNLVQTVPPEGVDRLDAGGTAFDNEGIYLYNEEPEHRLKTTYAYNSLNQVVSQTTPDGGTTNFWYDDKGQLRFSQNAEQFSDDSKFYSYTKYDGQGRIIEVGESGLKNTQSIPPVDHGDLKLKTSDASFPTDGWDITFTFYDGERTGRIANHSFLESFAISTEVNGFGVSSLMERNLRNRVSSTFMYEGEKVVKNYSPYGVEYVTASHYAYDAHGNVKRLVQEDNSFSLFAEPTFYTIDYEYDLLSGNVKKVNYQRDEVDQFMHQYYYDADNRITDVFSSKKGYIWENDASYFYYLHGPLARMELGEDKVQGTDYAYTLQGWLKVVNASTIDKRRDMSIDGDWSQSNVNQYVGRDAFGYSIDYFDADYEPIASNALGNEFLALNLSSNFGNAMYQLYNGNIHRMTVSLSDENESPLASMGYEHRYDQLNRIVERQSWSGTSLQSGNTWAGALPVDDYKVHGLAYDANGNITHLKRIGAASNDMDDLVYDYNEVNSELINNKLKRVVDHESGSIYNDDLKTQLNPNNYQYDLAGNLIKDVYEGIDEITWNAYGKIKEIKRVSGHSGADLEFVYDPAGNRVIKIVKTKNGSGNLQPQGLWKSHYYVRDAQGNVMSNYEQTYSPAVHADHYNRNMVQKELPLYGSSRLGVLKVDTLASQSTFKALVENGKFVAFQTSSETNWGLPTGGGDFGFFSPDTSVSILNENGTTEVKLYSLSPIDVFSNELIQVVSGNASAVSNPNWVAQVRIPAGEVTTLSTSSANVGFKVASSSPVNFTMNDNLNQSDDYVVKQDSNAMQIVSTVPPWANVKNFKREMDQKRYELSNHLGNVYQTVSNRKIGKKGADDIAEHTFNGGTGPIYELDMDFNGSGNLEGFVPQNQYMAVTWDTDRMKMVSSQNYARSEKFMQLSTGNGEEYYFTYDIDHEASTFLNIALTTYNGGVGTVLQNYRPPLVSGPQQVTVKFINYYGYKMIPACDSLSISFSNGGAYAYVDNIKIRRVSTSHGLGGNTEGFSPDNIFTEMIWDNDRMKTESYTVGQPNSSSKFMQLNTGNGEEYSFVFDIESSGLVDIVFTTFNGGVGTQLSVFRTTTPGPRQVVAEFKDAFNHKLIPACDSIQIHISGSGAAIWVDNIDIKQTNAKYYLADVKSYADYYPFGSLQPNRYGGDTEYKYGFNGKESDNEVKGNGNQYDYGFRIYDPRVGKFLSVDPLTKDYPELTPYQYASNTPIQAIDLDGLEAFFVHGTNHGPDAWTPELTNYITEHHTNSTHQDASFSWKQDYAGDKGLNKLTNNEDDRRVAAAMLVEHVINFRKENAITDEEITLVGYSHGGNVSIQAAKKLKKQYGIQVNIVTINTPAYNGNGDAENPAKNEGINNLTHFYSKGDKVAGGAAGNDKFTDTPLYPTVGNYEIIPKEKGGVDAHLLENVSIDELKKSGAGKPSKIWSGSRNPEKSYTGGTKTGKN